MSRRRRRRLFVGFDESYSMQYMSMSVKWLAVATNAI